MIKLKVTSNLQMVHCRTERSFLFEYFLAQIQRANTSHSLLPNCVCYLLQKREMMIIIFDVYVCTE